MAVGACRDARGGLGVVREPASGSSVALRHARLESKSNSERSSVRSHSNSAATRRAARWFPSSACASTSRLESDGTSLASASAAAAWPASTHATAKISAEDSGNAADSPDHDNNSATAPARETRRDKGDDRRTRMHSEFRVSGSESSTPSSPSSTPIAVFDSVVADFDSVIAVFAAVRDGANEGFGERGGRARIDRRGRWYSEYVREPNRHARTRRSDVERRRGGIRLRGFFEQTPGEHRANGRDVRESDAPVPSRGGTDRVQQRVRHATPIGIRPGSNRRRRSQIDRVGGVYRIRRRRRIRRSAEGHQARRRASDGGGDQRARLCSIAFEASRSRGRRGGRRAAQIFVRDRGVVPFRLRRRSIRGTLQVDPALGRGAAWRAGVSPSPRPPPRALPPEATPRDWRARTRPRRRRNARRDLRVWRRRRPVVSDRNRRPADPTRPSVPRATRDREPGWEGERPRRRLEGPGQCTTAWWSSVWSSRSNAREKSASSNRRFRFRPSSGNAYRVAFGLPGDVPPEDASRTYPNVVSQFVHVQSVRIHHLERSLRRRLVLQLLGGEFAAFVTPSKRIAAEHAVLHGSHLFGSTNPRERSRHTDAPSVDRRNGPINSAMSTPRSDARRTSRAASAARGRVGTTSTSRMPSSGTPRTIQGVVAPSRGEGRKTNRRKMNHRRGRVPPRTDPTSGTFASTPPTCDRSNRSAREALHSRAYVRRETRNSGRTDRPRATPGRARSRRGPSPTTREGGSRSRVPSVSFAPTIRPRVRRPVADKRGTRVKFVRTRVAFEARAGSPLRVHPRVRLAGYDRNAVRVEGLFALEASRGPPREPTVHAGMTRQRQLTTRLGDA